MEDNLLYEVNTKGKVLYIRHGETYYNLESKTNKALVKANPSYIDSNLTSKGLAQAKEVSKILSTLTIEKIYTSPLLRCLQTTYYALEHHPNVSEIVVFVHPLLIEVVGGMQDWNHDTKGKKAKFNMTSKVKFDWSIFDTYYQTDIKRELFCLEQADVIDNSYAKLIKEAEELFKKDNKTSLAKAIASLITEGLINRKEKKLETLGHVFRRNIAFKQYLLKEIESSSSSSSSLNKDSKIIVFTHSGFVKLSTSKSAYTMNSNFIDLPQDVYQMKNCECISMIINKTNCTMLNNDFK